jgi:MFS family permease
VLAWGTALIGVGFGLTALAHSASHYMVTVLIWTLGEIAVVPIASTVVAALAPPALRGTYQGAYSVAWAISWIVGPVAGTQALASFGGRLWARVSSSRFSSRAATWQAPALARVVWVAEALRDLSPASFVDREHRSLERHFRGEAELFARAAVVDHADVANVVDLRGWKAR